MKIARVFPTKTSMSPTDPLAFFGPPTLEAMAAEPEAVHISVTFSWDIPIADDLYYQWEMLGVPVEVGGPAFGDHMSESFTPGRRWTRLRCCEALGARPIRPSRSCSEG